MLVNLQLLPSLAWAGSSRGRIEPLTEAMLVPDCPHFWEVGVAFDRGADNVVGEDLVDDQLFGLSLEYRRDWFGANARLMFSPNFREVEDIRTLTAGILRAHTTLWGIEWSYGLGTHLELRLRDHFWLAYATPLELGAAIWSTGSFRVRLYGGVRATVAGELINSYLIDPNGFENENAADALSAEKGSPWEGFLSLVFSRRVD